MNPNLREARCSACLTRRCQGDADRCSACTFVLKRARYLTSAIAGTYGEARRALIHARAAEHAHPHMRPLYLLRVMECRHWIARMRGERASLLAGVRARERRDAPRVAIERSPLAMGGAV